MGYTPCIHQPERSTDVPTLGKRLNHIKEAREAAQEAQCKAQETWIKNKPYKPFVLGDKVWLEGTNLKLPANLTQKLSPRRYGPFEVAAIISKSTYRLKLPPTWRIYNVFHVSLLTPYKETEQHGPNFLELPPDIIEGEPEWEVEQILQTRLYGRGKKRQYLVRWKGYSPLHDSWVNESDMNAPELIQEFHASHPTAIRTSQDDSNNGQTNNSNPPIVQECIKTLEITEQDAACPPSEPSFSETPTSTVHYDTTNSNKDTAHILLTTMLSNIPGSVKNPTAPTTIHSNNTPVTEPCLSSTPTSLTQDSLHQPSLLWEQTTGSSSSVLTQQEINCISSLLALKEKTSTSISTGPSGHNNLEATPQISPMEHSSCHSTEMNISSEPQYNINKVNSIMQNHPNNHSSSHKDIQPYLRKDQVQIQARYPSTQQTKEQEAKNRRLPTADTTAWEATIHHSLQKLKEKTSEQYTKEFIIMDNKWKTFCRRFDMAMAAKVFRKTSPALALYLLCIHPQLYLMATTSLKAKGIKIPNPYKTKWATSTAKKENLITLRAVLNRPHNHMVAIPLGGTSCYNPPQFSLPFSTLPLSPVLPPTIIINKPPSALPTPRIPMPPVPWNQHILIPEPEPAQELQDSDMSSPSPEPA